MSLIEEPSKIASPEVPVPMRTPLSFRDLKDFYRTFNVVGFMFVFTTVLIASVVRLLLDLTRSLNRLSDLERRASE